VYWRSAFFAQDANTSLIKSRQFGEYMVKEIAALSGVYYAERRETTNDLISWRTGAAGRGRRADGKARRAYPRGA